MNENSIGESEIQCEVDLDTPPVVTAKTLAKAIRDSEQRQDARLAEFRIEILAEVAQLIKNEQQGVDQCR